jgi:bacteriocin biosynthesis cyclodehydratase domain-containing protein
VLRVRPGAHVLAITADTLQIAFANYTATFNSPPVVQAATALLELLGEPINSDAAVRDAASATGLTEPFVRYVLETLARMHCIIDVPDGVLPRDEPIDAFYGYMSDNAAGLQADLSAARPLLVHFGGGLVDAAGLAIASGLHATEALAVVPGAACQDALDEIAERIAHVSALVVWGLPYRLGLTGSLNDLAIAHDTPVLFGACEGLVGRVGPYVIPGNTACLECATNRLLANAGAPERRALPAFRARYRDVVPEPWPTHPVFEQAVLAQWVLELTRIVGRVGAQTIGGMLEYRFGDGCAERHTVLRVPRCPACHPARPSRLPWDAVFPAPVVKNSV